jgi:hypothetical protein
LLKQLTELREMLTYIYWFVITDVIKDIEEDIHVGSSTELPHPLPAHQPP